MRKAVAIAMLLASASPGFAAGPAQPLFESFGRADELARVCQNAEELFGYAFNVGTCLALERENATNEVALVCGYLKQNGFLPFLDEEGNPVIANVADCIAALRDI